MLKIKADSNLNIIADREPKLANATPISTQLSTDMQGIDVLPIEPKNADFIMLQKQSIQLQLAIDQGDSYDLERLPLSMITWLQGDRALPKKSGNCEKRNKTTTTARSCKWDQGE